MKIQEWSMPIHWICTSCGNLNMDNDSSSDKQSKIWWKYSIIFVIQEIFLLSLCSTSMFIWADASESLDINFRVSSALVEIVRRIKTKPRYILAKVLLAPLHDCRWSLSVSSLVSSHTGKFFTGWNHIIWSCHKSSWGKMRQNRRAGPSRCSFVAARSRKQTSWSSLHCLSR